MVLEHQTTGHLPSKVRPIVFIQTASRKAPDIFCFLNGFFSDGAGGGGTGLEELFSDFFRPRFEIGFLILNGAACGGMALGKISLTCVRLELLPNILLNRKVKETLIFCFS
jgi:hypothetical protein